MTRLTKNNKFITFGGSHITFPTYTIPRNGLFGEWLFTNGSTDDTSDSGYNASTVNSPTTATDRFGNPNSAYNCEFGYILTPTITFPTIVSFSFWFKTSNTAVRIIGNRFTQTDGFEIYLNSGGVLEYLQENPLMRITSQVYNDDEWNHGVFMIDTSGKTVELYVNNVERSVDGSTTTMLPINNNPIEFGYSGGLQYVDDIRLYNRKLTPTEIESLYYL